MSKPKRKGNSIAGAFVPHSLTMLTSPAWRALPDNARRILERLETEHMQHGGAENGYLPCTYNDFERAGIRRKSIPLAIRAGEALGFLKITRKGGGSTPGFQKPSLYFLTYLSGIGRSLRQTDEWQRIGTDEAARAALARVDQLRMPGGENAPALGAKTPLLRPLPQGRKRPSYPRGGNAPPIYISGRVGQSKQARSRAARSPPQHLMIALLMVAKKIGRRFRRRTAPSRPTSSTTASPPRSCPRPSGPMWAASCRVLFGPS